MDAIDCFFSITSFLGLGDWKKIVQDTRDARKQLEIEEMHKKEEKSEEMSTGNHFYFTVWSGNGSIYNQYNEF